ncbi:MAG TPA: MBL fold metallo-hydrolase [Azospirillaceae bacterium]|nr:MBL fold metallo-hydrolase [Azospirillaceae bacterium]HRQ81079.1 MBL fold metallo-hydrolase [Azospirillaceae bacterium]
MRFAIIPVTPFQQNCSLLWCEETKEAAAIDAGGDVARIIAAAEKQGVKLVKLLNTHGHLDHVGGVATLVDQLALPVEGPHPEDDFWIKGMPEQCRMFGFPPTRSFTPDRWLAEGDEVEVGKVKLEVRHCPGHTPGHVVFIHHPSKTVFVGDVLFQGSIGRTDFPKGDHATLLASIRDKLLSLGDDYSFVPGHGPMSTMGEERRYNPYLNGFA